MCPSPGRAGETFGDGGQRIDALTLLVGSADATFVIGPQLEVVAAYRRRPARAGILGGRPFEAIDVDDRGRVLDVLDRLRQQPGPAQALTVRAHGEGGQPVRAHLVLTDGGESGNLVIRTHILAAAPGDDGRSAPHLTAAEIAPAGIAISDELGRPLYANAWLRRRLPNADGSAAPDWLGAVGDRASAETLLRDARAGRPGAADLWFNLVDGHRCLRVRVESRPGADGDPPGVVATFVDVTEAVEGLRRVERNERLLATTLAALSQGVVVFDSDGNVVIEANEAAHDLVGVPRGTLVGTPADELARMVAESGDGQPQRPGDHHLRRARAQGAVPGELAVRWARPDGEHRWLLGKFRPVPGPGGTLIVCTFTDVTAQHEQAERLSRQATHDALTGLPNRPAALEHLAGALARQRRRRRGLCAVLFCDLDGFKAVNDTFGHQTGDRVLVVAADRIRVSCREADRVGRLGGDEFVVILEELHEPDEIRLVADRIVSALREPISVGDGVAHLGVSIGTAISVGDDDPETLLSRADGAMYRAKQAGGWTWRHWRPGMPAADGQRPRSRR